MNWSDLEQFSKSFLVFRHKSISLYFLGKRHGRNCNFCWHILDILNPKIHDYWYIADRDFHKYDISMS